MLKNIPAKILKLWITAAVIVTALLILAYGSLPDGLLHVYFLDVGQGDAILIQTPNSKFILVDGGPDDKVLTEMSDV
ncbi:hypothetical protein KKG51_04080, partial [Patescibacteria group bacterium]|nr:hypothetical protein [Patescibacteria group bacterium]